VGATKRVRSRRSCWLAAQLWVEIFKFRSHIWDLDLYRFPLERFFLQKFAAEYKKPLSGMTRRAQSRLANYSWPGNIRELENVIGNACMMVDGPVIDVGDLPEEIRGPSRDLPSQDDMLISLEELQKRHTMRVLERVGGNKSHAAEILGISRATIYQLIGQARSASS